MLYVQEYSRISFPMNVQIYEQGMRQYVMWYAILQEAAGAECHATFSRLVPALAPDPLAPDTLLAAGTDGASAAAPGAELGIPLLHLEIF